MLARLILALLLAAFALPALANGPCHDAPHVAVQHHAGHRSPLHKDAATPAHVCLGCIPPASLASRALPAPPLRLEPARAAATVRFDRLATLPPALPPPRSVA